MGRNRGFKKSTPHKSKRGKKAQSHRDRLSLKGFTCTVCHQNLREGEVNNHIALHHPRASRCEICSSVVTADHDHAPDVDDYDIMFDFDWLLKLFVMEAGILE